MTTIFVHSPTVLTNHELAAERMFYPLVPLKNIFHTEILCMQHQEYLRMTIIYTYQFWLKAHFACTNIYDYYIDAEKSRHILMFSTYILYSGKLWRATNFLNQNALENFKLVIVSASALCME